MTSRDDRQRNYKRAYYLRNRERILAAAKARTATRSDSERVQLAAYKVAWYQLNKQRVNRKTAAAASARRAATPPAERRARDAALYARYRATHLAPIKAAAARYVAQLLVARTALRIADIPREMIEAKRLQLLITRHCKENA